jgi:predicted HAD superfamily Cof-like phosphohydrolase
MNHLEQAIQFRETYRQPILSRYSDRIASGLREALDTKTLNMQLGCINEEARELNEAVEQFAEAYGGEQSALLEAKAHMLKELADLAYVCYQLAAFLGLDLHAALDLVHESNMSKLDPDGNPIFNEKGKVMKGPGYRAPDLSGLV